MPYSLHEDNLGRDPRWAVLARHGDPDSPDLLELSESRRRTHLARLEARRRMLIASYYLMTLETSAHKDDGYLTLEAALVCCGGEVWQLEALATAVCGRPPFLHRQGDRCSAKNCVDSSPPWRNNYEYRICSFLKRNPSKVEQDRNKAQKDDARDPQLRALLLKRDGRFCRYCRSGPLSEKAGKAAERRKVLQRDHVDPDLPAGPDAENYVTTCASCNEHKARRTPFEADMTLLDPPTEAQIQEWTEAGLTLFDPPWITSAITNRITDESRPDHRHISDHDGDQHGDPVGDSSTPDDRPARPETLDNQQDHVPDHRPEGFGSGRVGDRPDGHLGALGQPVRGLDSPDIYHRRSRSPAPPDTPSG
ncbi:HNH endonuclease [Actinocrispum wychmicini]|uniref:HNH endonuclease n=1 Tax=Actinocrispum wychmicini TaxID=1213861 RepID=A0A4R2JZX7_9PSEU|nr:HNH endonuclease [Actinocrispum wychmicini]TCO64927.1 hypothetical protein EV192_101711 [Actinocrispum wychmicini]